MVISSDTVSGLACRVACDGILAPLLPLVAVGIIKGYWEGALMLGLGVLGIVMTMRATAMLGLCAASESVGAPGGTMDRFNAVYA
jgi:hypothetical protein